MFPNLSSGGIAAITFPIKEEFEKFPPTKTKGFFFRELEEIQSICSQAGFVNMLHVVNRNVKFGCNCLIGTKPDPGKISLL